LLVTLLIELVILAFEEETIPRRCARLFKGAIPGMLCSLLHRVVLLQHVLGAHRVNNVAVPFCFTLRCSCLLLRLLVLCTGRQDAEHRYKTCERENGNESLHSNLL